MFACCCVAGANPSDSTSETWVTVYAHVTVTEVPMVGTVWDPAPMTFGLVKDRATACDDPPPQVSVGDEPDRAA